MGSNEFFIVRSNLLSGGFIESKRRFLDWFLRDYIKKHECEECDAFGLLPIILRSQKKTRIFGKCKRCGNVQEF